MKMKSSIYAELEIIEDVVRAIESGAMRKKYGLNTNRGSDYEYLRQQGGLSDIEAQVRCYLMRGILKADWRQQKIEIKK